MIKPTIYIEVDKADLVKPNVTSHLLGQMWNRHVFLNLTTRCLSLNNRLVIVWMDNLDGISDELIRFWWAEVEGQGHCNQLKAQALWFC